MQKTGVIFALIRDNKILMQQRDENSRKFPLMWCIPGGARDESEDYETTLLREVKEEYDLDLKLDQCTYIMDHSGGNNKVYVCKVGHDQEPKLQEGLAMRWMTIEEIEKIELGFNQGVIIQTLKTLIV